MSCTLGTLLSQLQVVGDDRVRFWVVLGTSLEGSGGTFGERNLRIVSIRAEKAECCQGGPFQKVVFNLGPLNCLNILHLIYSVPLPSFNPFCCLMLKSNREIKAYFSVTVA